jgi:hypothetical protein
MSAASFDLAVFVAAAADGPALGEAVAGVAGAVGSGDCDRSAAAGSVTGRGLTMNPASAMTVAIIATTTNGAIERSVPRGIDRIFIE